MINYPCKIQKCIPHKDTITKYRTNPTKDTIIIKYRTNLTKDTIITKYRTNPTKDTVA